MRRFAIFWSVLVIFAAAIASYSISLHVGDRYERVRSLKKQMRTDADAIRMLETELTYRASPQRLQALVDAHGLQLALPKADQYLVATADLAPQPGDVVEAFIPQPRAPEPFYADNMPLMLPQRAPQQAPVQLASLSTNSRLVAFAEPVTPSVDLAAQPYVQPVTIPEKITITKSSSKPPRAETVADVREIQKQKFPASATKVQSAKSTEPKKKARPPANPESKKSAGKPKLTETPEFAEKISTPKSEQPKPAAPRRLDSALIASIETAAAKEASKP
jgi:hypothetical protein